MIFVTRMNDGSEVRWRDSKRYLWILSVLIPSVPALSAFIMISGGNPLWSVFPLVFYFGFIPAVDWIVGETRDNPPEAIVEQLAADQWYRILLHAALGVLWVNFLFSAWAAGSFAMPWWAFVALAIGAGVAGGAGLTVGHELGHKQSPTDRFAAKLACALTGYAHFPIEHNRGHHTQVATPEDPASARYGESVWRFLLREIPGAAARGWRHERERLGRRQLPFWHWKNDLLQGYAITLIVQLAFIAAFGPKMILYFLVHNAVGWFQLTLANYVEHYGLKREKRADGRYLPCEPRHSWNTNHIVSNLLLFHLQRHSDHHANPARPYQALRNFDELPTLPSGYPGAFVLAIVPAVWFRVMNPKVMEWAGGDIAKVNQG